MMMVMMMMVIVVVDFDCLCQRGSGWRVVRRKYMVEKCATWRKIHGSQFIFNLHIIVIFFFIFSKQCAKLMRREQGVIKHGKLFLSEVIYLPRPEY